MNQKIEVNHETENRLPDKLSDLVTLALDDADKLNRKFYTAASGRWHLPVGFHANPGCDLCLAGMVIAWTLEGAPATNFHPEDFKSGTRGKLLALDAFRNGFLETALQQIGTPAYIDSPRVDKRPSVRAIKQNIYTERMVSSSIFSGWEEFDRFAFYAREVGRLLAFIGF